MIQFIQFKYFKYFTSILIHKIQILYFPNQEDKDSYKILYKYIEYLAKHLTKKYTPNQSNFERAYKKWVLALGRSGISWKFSYKL